MLLSSLLDSILIVLSFVGAAVIYDTGIYWAASQVVLCPLLAAINDVELDYRKSADPKVNHIYVRVKQH